MKFRNKKTGEIRTLYDGYKDGKIHLAGESDLLGKLCYDSLKELCEDWEDVPEKTRPFEEVAKATYEVETTTHYLKESAAENERRGVGVRGPKYIKIADIDYYEILPDGTKKTEFTWDEAMEIEKKTHGKWRVPTQAEWFAIAAAFGSDKDGKVTGETLAKSLNLTTDKDGYGNFWSSTVGGDNAHYLYFYSTNVYPQDLINKVYGFTVRCVAR